MRKLFKYLLLIPLLTANFAFAFLNGSTLGSTPWITPVPGAVWVSFNVGAPINNSFQAINDQPSVNVITLKILQVSISPNIAVGQTATVSYLVQNTSISNPAANVANIVATLNFYKPGTGNVTVGHYNVVPVAGNPTLIAGGVTALFQFRVTPTSARTTGNYIVDGDISGTAPAANDRYFNWNAFTYTAAVTPGITREMSSTLNIATINIIAPPGAVGGTLSASQNFTISFNVQNLGDSDVVGIKQVIIDWQGATQTLPFLVGQPLNVVLAANNLGTSLVTVSIDISAPPNPIDEQTGAQVKFLNRIATLSVTVVTPSRLDIMLIDVPTAQVRPLQPGPVIIGVGVQNLGSTNATINPTIGDLSFLVSGNTDGSYLIIAPGSVTITPNQRLTLNYTVTQFGSQLGLCTVNVTINGIDQSSGLPVSASALPSEMDTFWVRYSYPTLNLSAVQVVSPNGAVDKIISLGQDFWISCNVQNIGETGVSGNKILRVDWDGSSATQNFNISQPVTFNLTANNLGVLIVTVSIENTAADHPTDALTGLTVNYLSRISTISITVQKPAQLDILSISIPTTQVQAFQAGPVTVSVRVQNIGSANATINLSTVQPWDTTFLVGGIDCSLSYFLHPNPAFVQITENQIVTLSYVIDFFGGGTDICTVSATVNAIDQNSGWVTSAASEAGEIATYNVTYNAGVVVGVISTDRNPIGYLGSFQVYVPITRLNAGETINVHPATSDLTIFTTPAGPNLAGISFNVTSVIPANFVMNDGSTSRVITYNVTVLSSAVSGTYTINVLPSRPTATNNATALDVSDPDGGVPTTNVIYDPVSPNLIFATPNINNIPLRLTRPTDNFYLTLEFSETMNAAFLPALSFVCAGTAPVYSTGTWNGPLNNIFLTNVMNLVTVNQGYVTVNLTGGAQDLAGNNVIPSPAFTVFYVDALKPTGSVTINNGQAITSNPLVSLNFNLVDDYSIPASMDMYIFGLPTSNVSSNPGITVDAWIPYNQSITMNLDTLSFSTKNIVVMFRDQAGNISNTVSDSIFLDTDIIIWVRPTSNAMVSNNFFLNTATSIFADSVSYYVSVNNVLTLISANVEVSSTGTCNYLWTSANIYPVSTTNAELVAAVSKNNTMVTASIVNITIDNNNPAVTISYPLTLTYVNGVLTISGNASDYNTSVNLIELSFNGGATYAPAVGTDNWTYLWTVPPADPDPTTYNLLARAWDLAGNSSTSNLVVVTKTNLQPTINLNIPPSPSLNRYLKNMFHFEGTVTSLLELAEVRISFGALTTNILAVGTTNWAVTFDIPEALLVANTGPVIPLQVVAITTVTPNTIRSTANFNYRVDGVTPNLAAINIVNGMGAIGTLNVTGIFNDVGSGITSVQVSVDGGTWTTISFTGGFVYPLGIVNPTHNISFRAYDDTYLTPNVSDIFTYTITQDFSLLPTGVFINPPSGSYVNNTMNMSGTINVHDGGTVAGVWVRYVSNTSDSGWVTANFIGVNWTYNWRVPSADAHNTTYDAGIRVLSSTGMMAEVSPFVQASYIKDMIGPSTVIVNLVNGMYLPAVQSPAPVRFRSYTDGALALATYLMVDGVTYNPGVLNPPPVSQNTSWVTNWDFITQPGSAHVIGIRAVDRVGNWTDSNTLNIRTVPTRIVTEPLPSGNVIDGATTMTNPIYATSLNIVSFNNITPANIVAIYVDSSGIKTPIISGLEVGVTMAITTAAMVEGPYVITIIESDGLTVTAHYQPVVFDRTPPTVNVFFNGVARYYPDGYIAPNERFMVNVWDRTASGDYGAGFSATAHFSYVTDNPTDRIAGAIQRSVFNNRTTVDNSISGDTFDPYAEILRFNVNLSEGTYDLSLDAIDNAGNAMVATLNVFGMIVADGATGLSGGIDTKQFITSYPNPYDPADGDVKITYYLKDNAKKTRIFIYNEVGELLNIMTIEGPEQEGTHAGYNAVDWDAQDKFGKVISNGVYLFMVVVEGEKNQTMAKGKMAVLRR